MTPAAWQTIPSRCFSISQACECCQKWRLAIACSCLLSLGSGCQLSQIVQQLAARGAAVCWAGNMPSYDAFAFAALQTLKTLSLAGVQPHGGAGASHGQRRPCSKQCCAVLRIQCRGPVLHVPRTQVSSWTHLLTSAIDQSPSPVVTVLGSRCSCCHASVFPMNLHACQSSAELASKEQRVDIF